MAYGPTGEEAHLEGLRTQSKGAYASLLAARDAELVAKRKSIGPSSDRWQLLEVRWRDAEEKKRAVYAKLQRPTDAKRISAYWALFIAIGLAALEAPINKFMLDNILRGSNFDSYAISLFMTFICLGLGHMAGILARQIRGTYHENIYISNIVGFIAILAVLVVWIGALTIGRAFYSVASPTSLASGIFSEITRQVTTIGPWTAFTRALSDQAAFFLACLNTAGVAFVFLLAFMTHDSDRVYQSVLDEAEKATSSRLKLERKYNGSVDKIAAKYGPKLEIISTSYGAQNARLVELKRMRGAELNDDDRFNVSSLDIALVAAREEFVQKSQAAANEGNFVEGAPKLGETGVTTFGARARQMSRDV